MHLKLGRYRQFPSQEIVVVVAIATTHVNDPTDETWVIYYEEVMPVVKYARTYEDFTFRVTESQLRFTYIDDAKTNT